MLESRKTLKVISSLIIGLSIVGVGSGVAQATLFTAPKLGTAEVVPTDPSIKKGDKIFVVVKDTNNQKVAVYNQNAKKTGAKVTMGSTYTAKAVKKEKIVKINKSQWLNSKDVVKN
ncbi:hypothetical protein LA20531_04765 [Lactobacillus amylovorus DSM 20531]|jgi:hypothetical protein|uniref:hypothetical protein n=1 Tax=Lactobacillus amylovorus TaxID=1604 RepID=UPI0006EFAEB4|nr:hypothetical protein [Lactobacillus amylovorus]ATO52994.1 hypothetical protein LA20531_04765 [Lactobacillus amylovorus DSM 20531]KRK44675.1 hypothetical protein FC63_GL001348 [Lactobacillus amylovorus DSM 20531]MCT3591830.1 hypothetical protein [Lactobacillus amylovorus]